VTNPNAQATLVLVATDFSSDAAAAHLLGAELARRTAAEVKVLHVADQRNTIEETYANAWLRKLGVQPRDMILRNGVPWMEIVQCSEDLRAAFVVVGTRGQSSASIQVPGSTTLSLLRYSRVPLIVVPASPLVGHDLHG
jgi:nucleotide-binding universal stress UspA family protein